MTKLFKAAILGAPASGKGTISSRIVKNFDVCHVSAGDLLRQNIQENTTVGKSAQKYMSNGKLVPDNIVTNLILTKLKELENRNWLCDGFPRTLVQAETLCASHPLNLVINLKVPFEVIIERVKGRWIHLPSGRVYNTNFEPPKVPGRDDVTGEPLTQREDDRPEAVEKRLNIYAAEVEPLLAFYREKGVLKEYFGKSSDEIWPLVRDTLNQCIGKE